MGIACVLVEEPLAGERSLVRNFQGKVGSELYRITENGPILAEMIFKGMARDCATALRIASERLGLTNSRIALFGVSFGTLLASYAFTRAGIGKRLLGTVGHADLKAFATSYVTVPGLSALAQSPVGTLVKVIARTLSNISGSDRAKEIAGGVILLRIVGWLASDHEIATSLNPLTHVSSVGGHRAARFLVGEADGLVRATDAINSATRFPDGQCFVVPGMGHGGADFVNHARFFLQTQLADWR